MCGADPVDTFIPGASDRSELKAVVAKQVEHEFLEPFRSGKVEEIQELDLPGGFATIVFCARPSQEVC